MTTTTTIPEPLLTAKDVAAWLNVHVDWVYEHAQTGELPAVPRRIGPELRFRRSEIEVWLDARDPEEATP